MFNATQYEVGKGSMPPQVNSPHANQDRQPDKKERKISECRKHIQRIGEEKKKGVLEMWSCNE